MGDPAGGGAAPVTRDGGEATDMAMGRGMVPPVVAPCQVGASGKTECISADQNWPMVAKRSAGATASAVAKTRSTASGTSTPRARGVGRREGSRLATASCMKSLPSSAARPPRRISTRISAMAKTSVHGPVAPCERLNCSGAP